MSEKLLQRFYKHTAPNGGCIEWTGAESGKDGYGRFYYNGRMIGAHKWIYESVYGESVKGIDVDHLCRNRRCVNLAHLEAVTHKENNLRGTALITHCPNGHEYTKDNTIYEYRGGGSARRCRACRRIYWCKAAKRRRQSMKVKP